MSDNRIFRPTEPNFPTDETLPIIRVPKITPPQTPIETSAVTETPQSEAETPAPQSATQTREPSSAQQAGPPTTPLVPPQPMPLPLESMVSDQVPTPPSLPPSYIRLESSVRLLWAMMAAVTTLTLVSLTVNVVLVTRLLAIRSQVSTALDSASHSLDNLSWQGLSFDFPVSQTINFEGDVPFKQDITFPFKGNIPINTTVSVPVDLGPLGKQTINVPINTTVPVDISVPVKIDQTFHIKTQVPVRMNIPIRLGPDDPPLKDLIVQARQWLENIRKFL